ncbi:MAG: Ni/Fe hydrogenase subunit alpha, partial [Candidatus Methanomethylicota archaeon]
MSRSISFYPITRIEGHAKVTIMLGDDGEVKDAYFHVMEFRGFEAFIRGRPVEEAPIIVTRICGLCSISHHLASVKAVGDVLWLDVCVWAEKRRLALHLAGICYSYALYI